MTEIIVCYSRCLYCGRRTPHEVCHDHSEDLHPGWWDALEDSWTVGDVMESLWGTGRDKEPEPCADPTCPVWEPGEWDHRQKWANMTTGERRAETDRLNREIEERRRQRQADLARGAQG
jgi:hypothetical protein